MYVGCNLALALMVFSTALDPYSITYAFKLTFFELSLYRPLTALLYLSRLGILFPFHLLFSFLATSRIANQVHPRLPDLAWFVIINIVSLMLFSSLVSNLYFYGSAFVMAMLVVWAVQHPTDRIRIPFEVYSAYFPIAYAVLMIALGSNYRNYVAGLLIGFVYGTIKNPVFVQQHGDLLPTPSFLSNYLRPPPEHVAYQPN